MCKLLCFIFCLFIVGQTNAQPSDKYEFWISSLDKASNDRLTYHVTSDSIKIKDGPYNFIYFAKNYDKDKLVFESLLNKKEITTFSKIGVAIKKDSLKSIYSNLCIMDGLILHFNFEWSDNKKTTTVSNIYVEKVKSVIDFVNLIVPKKYKIHYNKKGLDKEMKDCEQDLILD